MADLFKAVSTLRKQIKPYTEIAEALESIELSQEVIGALSSNKTKLTRLKSDVKKQEEALVAVKATLVDSEKKAKDSLTESKKIIKKAENDAKAIIEGAKAKSDETNRQAIENLRREEQVIADKQEAVISTMTAAQKRVNALNAEIKSLDAKLSEQHEQITANKIKIDEYIGALKNI